MWKDVMFSHGCSPVKHCSVRSMTGIEHSLVSPNRGQVGLLHTLPYTHTRTHIYARPYARTHAHYLAITGTLCTVSPNVRVDNFRDIYYVSIFIRQIKHCHALIIKVYTYNQHMKNQDYPIGVVNLTTICIYQHI